MECVCKGDVQMIPSLEIRASHIFSEKMRIFFIIYSYLLTEARA